MDDREFLHDLVRRYYPETYAEIHGLGSATEVMVADGRASHGEVTVKDLKAEAKRSGIPCFNWMGRGDLVAALGAKMNSDTDSLSEIVERARARYRESWRIWREGKSHGRQDT